MSDSFDILVIGAGIAGSSVAAELAADANVALLDMEAQPGFHATGRSAASFSAAYGNEAVRALTRASEAFYRTPSPEFAAVALLRPRDTLYVGSHAQRHAIDAMREEIPSLQDVDPTAAHARVPIFNEDYPACALLDPDGGDLDVDAILQGYLRQLRSLGGTLQTGCQVRGLSYSNGSWQVDCGESHFTASTVVNAAGAWADQVAEIAGLNGLGISPLRRSACLVDAPPGVDLGEWPLVVDADEQFYFKPDAGALLISPADETPSPACDAQAEELDIAIAIDRVMQVTGLQVQRVNHSWAGLRSFAPDRTFVAGFDPRADGFFWLAGQGGYGVQSAPALARISRYIITQSSLDSSCQEAKPYISALAPDRLILS